MTRAAFPSTRVRTGPGSRSVAPRRRAWRSSARGRDAPAKREFEAASCGGPCRTARSTTRDRGPLGRLRTASNVLVAVTAVGALTTTALFIAGWSGGGDAGAMRSPPVTVAAARLTSAGVAGRRRPAVLIVGRGGLVLGRFMREPGRGRSAMADLQDPLDHPRPPGPGGGGGARTWWTRTVAPTWTVGGIGCAPLGHADPRWVEAISRQLGRVRPPPAAIARAAAGLRRRAAQAHAHQERAGVFCSTGTESTEASIKLALKATGRDVIIAFDRAFHGRSLGLCRSRRTPPTATPSCAPSMTRERASRRSRWCGRLWRSGGRARAPRDHRGRVAAIFLEPIQGEGDLPATRLSPGSP